MSSKKIEIGNVEAIQHDNGSEDAYKGIKGALRAFVYEGWFWIPLIFGIMAIVSYLILST
jgi:hypothetical protein